MITPPMPPFPVPTMEMSQNIIIPVGTIFPFAGLIAPPGQSPPNQYATQIESWGWMLCDGRTLSKYKYPDLFAVLGFQYGKSGSDEFIIPDYRGLFLRGVDARTDVDGNPNPALEEREPQPTSEGKSDEVGSTQTDAMQTHQHQYRQPAEPSTITEGKVTGAAVTSDKEQVLTSTPTDQTPTIPGKVKVSPTETRAVNIYTNFIIKYCYTKFESRTGSIKTLTPTLIKL